MLIHELDNYQGRPTSTDYLAIDTGTNTLRVPASMVGVSEPMTQAEIEDGTITDTRVVSPKVLHDSIASVAPVPSAMTQAEATAGTITETRVISPKVLKDSIETLAPVPDAMTQAEAEAGAVTATRVIAPKVLHDSIESIAGQGAVVLTQAEYDALSTAEKNNGKVYYVTDGTAMYQSASNTPATDASGNDSNVQSILNALGAVATNILANTSVKNGGLLMTKYGPFVVMNCPNDFPSLAQGYTNYVTIPEGWRPSADIRFICATRSSCFMDISHTTGVVRFYNPTAQSSATNGAFSGIWSVI